ncbi:OLC1v1020820C1 [Oldenlandia corymbosa var. corymbosa]|uniref:OLC1v1020820C1 n=1 Tax=Oldenlandia corymbosa var. corymbosa TaxID=529605 RepID=A0AAV1BXZ5_OLDCO|nr:OLC1v1020820C1 [Oldenlandia corymbosa var. corymbosa]
MKPPSSRQGRGRCSFSTTATLTSYKFQNEHSTAESTVKTIRIPVTSPTATASGGVDDHASSPPPPPQQQSPLPPSFSRGKTAALRIQSAYRSYVVRRLVKKMSAVNSEANNWQRLIQRQETVDAVRSSERERIRINEALMELLFRLDSVPGIDPTVRELRRHLSRRIVGLQEILDSVSDARIENWDGFLRDWDDAIAWMEKDVCRARGGNGHELEKFCAEHLGFHCLQRFLRVQ